MATNVQYLVGPGNRGACMGKMTNRIAAFTAADRAATAIEYGLIAALIAVAAIAAMSSVGTKLKATFNNVSANLK